MVFICVKSQCQYLSQTEIGARQSVGVLIIKSCEGCGEGGVIRAGVPTSLMMDPFDRAGYTSKMLRDQHHHTKEKLGNNSFK